MSEAKRDHSAFNNSAVLGRAVVRNKPNGQEPCSAPDAGGLRVLESWDNKPKSLGDPYNGIGARAISGCGSRK